MAQSLQRAFRADRRRSTDSMEPYHRQRVSLLVLAAFLPLVGCTSVKNDAVLQRVDAAAPSAAIRRPVAPMRWETGTFSQLPLRGIGDLVTYVDELPHTPTYTPLTAARTAQVRTMVDTIQTAITAMMAADCNVNWCAAVEAAERAGYLLGRYYDTVSSRWFIVGADGAGTGQAFFIINPEPRRDLVVEAPHVYATNAKLEGRTDTEGALILRQTLGRALFLNGADRCRGPAGGCGGTLSSAAVCDDFDAGDPFRQSDVGHNTDSVFHVLHQKFSDSSASAHFVQLHGNASTRLPSGGLSVSDGRTTANPASLATRFVIAIQNLPTGALAPGAVNDCATESDILCGFRNVQGRYTNDPTADCNGVRMVKGGTRFLHLEQRTGSPSLVDQPQPVIEALRAIVPCSEDCSLPTQVIPEPSTECGENL
jgi:hypothetical protein